MSVAPSVLIDPHDAAYSDIIARCGGDARGAVKALLCANELLEADLEKALRASSAGYRRRKPETGFTENSRVLSPIVGQNRETEPDNRSVHLQQKS